VIPLSGLAVQLLDSTRAVWGDTAAVFPGADGESPLNKYAPDHLMRETVQAAGMERATPHDLRRTAASKITALGHSRLVVARILNHKDNCITAIYDRYRYEPEKRAALEAWGQELARLVAGSRKAVQA
jgi:integrase